jgi:hypothetical protein
VFDSTQNHLINITKAMHFLHLPIFFGIILFLLVGFPLIFHYMYRRAQRSQRETPRLFRFGRDDVTGLPKNILNLRNLTAEL